MPSHDDDMTGKIPSCETKKKTKKAAGARWRITFLTTWPSNPQSTRAVSTMNILSRSRRVLFAPAALRVGFGARVQSLRVFKEGDAD